MSCYPEQTAADLARNYARTRFAEEIFNSPTYSVAVNICQNCGQSCDRLTDVPEFEFMGCDRCVEEAMGALQAEAAAERKPVKIQRMQGELFPEVA